MNIILPFCNKTVDYKKNKEVMWVVMELNL